MNAKGNILTNVRTSSSVMMMFGGKTFLEPRHRGSWPFSLCRPEYASSPLQDLP